LLPSVGDIRTHIAQRFEGRTITPFPSPHLIVPDFFPEPVFAKILEHNPFKSGSRGKEMIAASTKKKLRQDTPYDLRKQIDLERDDFVATPDAEKFWRIVSEALMGGDWLAKLIYRLYPPFFDLRFGEAVLSPTFFSTLRRKLVVQRHDAGFRIGPHTDAPHRVFTCIFAFAEHPGFEEFGTEMVRPKDPKIRCWGDLHHNQDDFEVATVAKYSPNSFLVFFKTRHSFHSVKPLVAGIPNDRYGAQLAYYEPSGGLFRDLSRPDLMENRTAAPIFRFDAFGRTLQLTRK
jgi:hypothetical protein